MNQWRGVVFLLGLTLFTLAVGRTWFIIATGGQPMRAAIDLAIVGVPALAILYTGLRLPQTSIRPEYYPHVAGWTVGGLSVMGAVFVLRLLHPGIEVQFAAGTLSVLVGVGSLSGLSVGLLLARVQTSEALVREQHEELLRTYRLERQNETLKRTERRLEEAVGKLETSNERLEQFAHAVSHDLQEPLRMVSSYLQLLERRYTKKFDEEGREFIEFAVDGADRMRAMIDGVLAFSRVESQGAPFDTVQLTTVLETVLADLQVKIDETDATVTWETLPAVRGDRQQLRQVFQNLLGNALEYRGAEPPLIHVTAERHRTGWKISVVDNGQGIDAADTNRIFDIFERLHAVGDHPGSGIGLALCKRIVERHGGEIWVDSEPGWGSTFSFTLLDGNEQISSQMVESSPPTKRTDRPPRDGVLDGGAPKS